MAAYTFASGMGMTVGRVAFGAIPLAFSLFLLGCLFSERRLLTALALVAILDSVVLAVRVVNMFADSSIRENSGLVRAEVFLYRCCPPVVCSSSFEESGGPPDRPSRKFRPSSMKGTNCERVFYLAGSSPVGLSKEV